MNPARKYLILELSDAFGNYYRTDLLNDRLLDQLNLKQADIKEVKASFKDMPGYFYDEYIRQLGNTTVGGGSIGFEIATYSKGDYEVQPFLRLDRGHKEGLKTEHLNPKVRVMHGNNEFILPEETGTNIFGRDFKRIEIGYPFEWTITNSYEPENKQKGKVVRKIKKKPDYTKETYKEE